jgi:shikimate dehydrogenase
LLRAAMACNLRTADGLGMLLRQAVPQFQLWFGKKPKITKELTSLLEQNLSVPQPRNQE